jgi:ethanolamine utilization protein EutN
MYLGRVIGTVVASRKYEGLAGQKLLVVQPLDHARHDAGEPHVACDTVQAGRGDFVWCVSAREAALALEPWFVPVDAAIVGIVEACECPGSRDAPPGAKAASAPRPAASKGRARS